MPIYIYKPLVDLAGSSGMTATVTQSHLSVGEDGHSSKSMFIFYPCTFFGGCRGVMWDFHHSCCFFSPTLAPCRWLHRMGDGCGDVTWCQHRQWAVFQWACHHGNHIGYSSTVWGQWQGPGGYHHCPQHPDAFGCGHWNWCLVLADEAV